MMDIKIWEAGLKKQPRMLVDSVDESISIHMVAATSGGDLG